MHSDSHSYPSFQPGLRVAAIKLCSMLALGFAVTACSSTPQPAKEQTKLELQIDVSDGVNPDEQGRAAPVMVRVYELKSAASFDAADFFSLQNDGKKLLGADALVTDEFILRPGDKQTLRRTANPEAVAIGVLAGYRELGQSVWRVTYKLAAAPDAAWYRKANKAKLKIYLDQQAITITELD
jgi:type VI secretion system protein VasD